jgi:polyhydroxyalkanoate synthesis repressor PhaR
MRTIRRYANRKMYDTKDSHYVNLTDLAKLIRSGEEIRVTSKETGTDLTSQTLTEILYTEAVRGTSPVSPGTFRRLLVSGLPVE